MQLKLESIKIENFKGINEIGINLAGETVTIVGKNGTGKTSVADAIFWMISDNTLDGKSNFNIISLDQNGRPVDKQDAMVMIGIWAGSKFIKLKKVYHQKWNKKTMTGYTTDHYFDDEPVSKTEYNNRISKIIDPQLFRILSDTSYFCNKLPVKDRRKYLFKLASNQTDAQIMKSDDRFKELAKRIGSRTMESYLKIIKTDRKQIESELNQLPAKIQALNESAPDVIGLNEDDLRQQQDQLKKQIADKLAGSDKLKSIGMLESEMIDIGMSIKKKYNEQLDKLYVKKAALHVNISSIDQMMDKLKTLAGQYHELKASKFKTADTCFACGQKIPPAMIADQRSKFETDREIKINAIDKQGRAINAQIEAVKGFKAEFDAIEKKIAEIDQQMKAEATAKQQQIKDQIDYLKTAETDDGTEQLDEQLTKIDQQLIQLKHYEMVTRKIDQYRLQQKQFAKKIEEMDSILDLIDEFNEVKAKLIEMKISDCFNLTDWKLFEQLQNGNMKEICEPYFEGVPYNTDLNTGAKVNVGIDVIQSLSDHYKLHCPIIIDNAESITSWIDCRQQIIKLKAVESEEVLKIINGG